MSEAAWKCDQCEITLCLSPLEKLQHKICLCLKKDLKTKVKRESSVEESNKSNLKKFYCDTCDKKMFLTPVDVLKHKRNCKMSK